MSVMTEAETETTFAELGLDETLLRGLDALGFETPTPIQAAAIPALLAGEDVIGQAQTGTGKTAAFALPLLELIDVRERAPQVLVLAPTRELAAQVCDAIQSYGRYMRGLSVLPVYGGQGMGVQLRELQRGVHIVVGTPGRLIDHLTRGTLDLSQLRAVVLDEADEMLRMGFLEEVETILDATPEGRQTVLFSATMPREIQRIAQRFLEEATEVKIKQEAATVDTVSQHYMFVSGAARFKALERYLEVEPFDGMIIFARTRAGTLELAEHLDALGYSVAPLNGDMNQPTRERMIERFRRGGRNGFDILVCTDVAARGLDVPRVSHVINFDLPTDTESYVHRIGRTGRAGREGKAIAFAGRRDRYMLQKIERATRQKIERMDVPSSEVVSDRRIDAFREMLDATLESADLDVFREIIEQLCAAPVIEEAPAVSAALDTDADTDADTMTLEDGAEIEAVTAPERTPVDIAAALMFLAQRDRPFHVPDEELEDRTHQRRGKHDRNNRNDRNDRNDHGGRDNRGGGRDDHELYRVEVGRAHGLQPKHLVGAIANEAGLRGHHIGSIEIDHDFATVELPPGMPTELLHHLQRVRVCGQQLQIKALRERGGRKQRHEGGRGRKHGRGHNGHGGRKGRGKRG